MSFSFPSWKGLELLSLSLSWHVGLGMVSDRSAITNLWRYIRLFNECLGIIWYTGEKSKATPVFHIIYENNVSWIKVVQVMFLNFWRIEHIFWYMNGARFFLWAIHKHYKEKYLSVNLKNCVWKNRKVQKHLKSQDTDLEKKHLQFH